MAKEYWEKWEYRLWKSDWDLGRCHPATRGIWAEWISSMMEAQTYFLTGTLDDLAASGRCTKAQAQAALHDLEKNDAATIGVGPLDGIIQRVTQNVTLKVTPLSRSFNGEITVISRKRLRDLRPKEMNRLRQQRFRDRHESNGDVTDKSQSKSKDNSTNVELSVEETPQAATTTKRGTRIPEPFLLTKVMREYAESKRPAVDILEETEKFVNHYRGKTGRDATKLDWIATWKNWILNARGNNYGTNQRKSEREKSAERGDNAERIADELERQARADMEVLPGDDDPDHPEVHQLGERSVAH
jgi:hypothetical protein